MEWFYLVSSIASAIAAILAWAAKLWWGREFAAAKDEIIKAKDAQIELLNQEIDSLKELTPMKIREYFLSVRTQMEEYNDSLKKQLDEAYKELKTKSDEIDLLKQEEAKNTTEIAKLEDSRNQINNAANMLKKQLNELKGKYEEQKEFLEKMPNIETNLFESISASSTKLANTLSTTNFTGFANISESMLRTYKFLEQEQELYKQLSSLVDINTKIAIPDNIFGGFEGSKRLNKQINKKSDDIEK